ncbi:MAG: tetratricopeptide repeat protein [Bacteroidales bacterium]
MKTERKKIYMILAAILMLPCLLKAQGENKFIRQGNRDYEKSKYPDSEILYRRALDKNKTYSDAVFNLGDALYKQKKFEDAGKQFSENSGMYENKAKKSSALYNLGNSYLMANKLKESIEAYENSLILKPGNMEAKYNLAYAQDLLKKQEQQKQQQQQQQQQQKQDQNKKDQENKDQDQKENQDQKQDNQKQQQQNQQAISKADAERLLNAIANDEKDVQKKVELARAAKEKERSLENW